MAKRFNSQVYQSNVTDWILTIINFLLLCRDLLLPRHIFLFYLLVEQHWFLLFGRRYNRISLTVLIICNRQLRPYISSVYSQHYFSTSRSVITKFSTPRKTNSHLLNQNTNLSTFTYTHRLTHTQFPGDQVRPQSNRKVQQSQEPQHPVIF